jgi:hypothetical protein
MIFRSMPVNSRRCEVIVRQEQPVLSTIVLALSSGSRFQAAHSSSNQMAGAALSRSNPQHRHICESADRTAFEMRATAADKTAPKKTRTGPAVRSASLVERRRFEPPVLFCAPLLRKARVAGDFNAVRPRCTKRWWYALAAWPYSDVVEPANTLQTIFQRNRNLMTGTVRFLPSRLVRIQLLSSIQPGPDSRPWSSSVPTDQHRRLPAFGCHPHLFRSMNRLALCPKWP